MPPFDPSRNTQKPQKKLTDAEVKKETERLNKILLKKYNLPTELPLVDSATNQTPGITATESAEKHSDAFKATMALLEGWYLELDPASHGEHREKISKAIEYLKGAGGLDSEIEFFQTGWDDIGREIEDTVADLSNMATQKAFDILSENPRLADRPKQLAKNIFEFLKGGGYRVQPITLRRASERAAEVASGRR